MNHRTSEAQADQKAQSEQHSSLRNKVREYDLAPEQTRREAGTHAKVAKLFPKLSDLEFSSSAQIAKSQVPSHDEIKQQRETFKREIALSMMQNNVGLRDKNTVTKS